MSELIYIKCGIENCSQYYEYKFDNLIPIALSAQWRNEESKDGIWTGLLPDTPRIGEKYELLIWGALKIDLSKNFWVTYFEPYTQHEGIDSEFGINSMFFCLVKKIDIIEIGIKNIRLNIEVLKTIDLKFANELPKAENEISELLDKEFDSIYYSIQNFKNFSLITLNYQSDVVLNFIVSKQRNKSKIIAENYWDFHENTWQFRNEELTTEQEKKYGIQHMV